MDIKLYKFNNKITIKQINILIINIEILIIMQNQTYMFNHCKVYQYTQVPFGFKDAGSAFMRMLSYSRRRLQRKCNSIY